MAQSLKDIIDGLSLTTGLKLCLDAGDSNSYNPSVQTAKWLDTSGNGYDFYRGTSAAGDAAEPTFNGSAGGLSPSEYWSFDGGDYFTYDATNEAWMDNLHKDGVTVSSIVIGQFVNTATPQVFFGTNGDASSGRIGFRHQIDSTERLQYYANNGSTVAQPILQPPTGGAGAITVGSVTVNMLSYNEATPSGIILSNTTTFTPTVAAITSPSASNATYTMQIGASGNAQRIVANGTRIYCVAIWEGVALTATQLTDLYNEINQRFNPVIKPGLFSNTNSFYSPTVTQATSAQTLNANRYDNSNTVYAPAVSVGAVTLNADLFTNGNTFYQHILSGNSAIQILVPDLFTRSNIFYAHNINAGAVTLLPNLFENTNTIYPHQVIDGSVIAAISNHVVIARRTIRR